MPPTTTEQLDPWINATEVARLRGVGYRTIYRWRQEGLGPDYETLPNGRVGYRLSAVRRWLDEQAERQGTPQGTRAGA